MSSPPRAIDLRARRNALLIERERLRADCWGQSRGDLADRSPGVEAIIRLEVLDGRIAALELEIQEAPRRAHTDGVVSVGDVVMLDFGAGPENYLLGDLDQAVEGVEHVTPGSPLGRVLLGARVGTSVRYELGDGRAFDAKVLATAGVVPCPA